MSFKEEILKHIHQQQGEIDKHYLTCTSHKLHDHLRIVGELMDEKKLYPLDPFTFLSKDTIKERYKLTPFNPFTQVFIHYSYGVYIEIHYRMNRQEIAILSKDKKISEYYHHRFQEVSHYHFSTSEESDEIPFPKKRKSMHPITKLLTKSDVDILKLYQLLHIENASLSYLGRIQGSDKIDFTSHESKRQLFLKKIDHRLSLLEHIDAPNISLLLSDKSIVYLGPYQDKDYIPSMMHFTQEDDILHYDIWGEEKLALLLLNEVLSALSEYPSSLDNRYPIS